MINGPIPGESLTKEPKNYAWERPPEVTDPEEAIMMHISRLQNEDRMNTVLDALEFGMVDLQTLVKGIMRSAVANGVHTIDVGLIAAPIVHEYIKQTADALDIEYDDGINIDKKREKDSQMRTALMARKKLEKLDLTPKETFERDDVVEDDAVETIMEEQEVPEEKPMSKGLGARPSKGDK
jgi:hypothetical protein